MANPGPSNRSTPDLLNTVKGIFADDPDPMLEEAKTMRKAKDNLAQSYDYFIKRHEKAKDNEEKNKVLNAAHRHYQKSKTSHKDHQDVVEAAYLDFLESIGTNPDDGTSLLDYSFFLEQYNKASSDTEREAANAAAHRYFSLQYQGLQDELDKAKASVAYQEFLDQRLPHGASFTSVGLPRPVQSQFDNFLSNFNEAKKEEDRVEAMSRAHEYFMQLSSSCKDESELARLGTAYQAFLGAQKESLVEFRATQAMAASMSASSSSSAKRSASRSSSSRSAKKTTTTTTRRSSSPPGPPRSDGTQPPPPGPPGPPPPPPPPPSGGQKIIIEGGKTVIVKEQVEFIMVKPMYYLRWLYLCMFFQLLFIFGIILIFLFGAFAGCWLRYTTWGLLVLIISWIVLIVLIIILGIFAPKRQTFPWFAIWLIVLTLILAVCLAMTSVYFNTNSIMYALVALMTIFLIVFLVTLLPIGYTGSRLVLLNIIAWFLCVIAFWIFLIVADITITTGWIYLLFIVLLIAIWVAVDAMMVITNKFVTADHDEWMFGAVCCYTDIFVLTAHLCFMPFASPATAK